jgi:hypothetical protein
MKNTLRTSIGIVALLFSAIVLTGCPKETDGSPPPITLATNAGATELAGALAGAVSGQSVIIPEQGDITLISALTVRAGVTLVVEGSLTNVNSAVFTIEGTLKVGETGGLTIVTPDGEANKAVVSGTIELESGSELTFATGPGSAEFTGNGKLVAKAGSTITDVVTENGNGGIFEWADVPGTSTLTFKKNLIEIAGGEAAFEVSQDITDVLRVKTGGTLRVAASLNFHYNPDYNPDPGGNTGNVIIENGGTAILDAGYGVTAGILQFLQGSTLKVEGIEKPLIGGTVSTIGTNGKINITAGFAADVYGPVSILAGTSSTAGNVAVNFNNSAFTLKAGAEVTVGKFATLNVESLVIDDNASIVGTDATSELRSTTPPSGTDAAEFINSTGNAWVYTYTWDTISTKWIKCNDNTAVNTGS